MRTRAGLPAPVSDGTKPPIAPAPGDLTRLPSVGTSSYVHKPTHRYKYIHIIKDPISKTKSKQKAPKYLSLKLTIF